MSAREVEVRRLWHARPRSRVLAWSVVLLLSLCVGAWFLGGFSFSDLGRTGGDALASFLERATPKPVRGKPWNWEAVGTWASERMRTRGYEAARITLAISVAAIVLAALAGYLLSLPAARTFAAPEAWLPAASRPRRLSRAAWGALRGATRLLLVFLRAIPEYVWAFLLFGMLGPSAWPAVLALALHNAGVLGRLGAEVVENLPPEPLSSLRALGARRSRVALYGVFPAALPRLLLYFFYRWETCVREATVLGMLGIVSLGYWIDDARHRFRYDELVLWILVGSALVLLGDLLSLVARSLVRRAR